jgi:hypothetical protein
MVPVVQRLFGSGLGTDLSLVHRIDRQPVSVPFSDFAFRISSESGRTCAGKFRRSENCANSAIWIVEYARARILPSAVGAVESAGLER